MIDQEFEGPLFKRLSHNDSGAAKSNVAGFVIPKLFRYFFPPLPDPTDAEPAPHRPLKAILILDDSLPVSVRPVGSTNRGGTRANLSQG